MRASYDFLLHGPFRWLCEVKTLLCASIASPRFLPSLFFSVSVYSNTLGSSPVCMVTDTITDMQEQTSFSTPRYTAKKTESISQKLVHKC